MLRSVPAPPRPRFQEPTAPRRERASGGAAAAPRLGMMLGGEQVAISGDLGEISRHHHAAPAVVIGVDGPLRFVADRSHLSRVALIAPGFRHSVDVNGGRMAVFLLPAAGAPLRAEPVYDLPRPGEWLELAAAVERQQLGGFEEVARCLTRQGLVARPLDERVRRAVTAMTDALDDNTAVGELSAVAGLSATRLMTLCREQLGTSLRGYRRWLRAFRVGEAYSRGASLTEAALAAGFASSAHLSAAVREQFGLRPSRLLTPQTRPAIRAV
jgi:AraC-like DNA-binding protein